MRGYTRHLYAEHQRMVRLKYSAGLTEHSQAYWDSVRRKIDKVEMRERGPQIEKHARIMKDRIDRIERMIEEARKAAPHAAP